MRSRFVLLAAWLSNTEMREGKDARCRRRASGAAVSRSRLEVCWMSRGSTPAKLSDGMWSVLTRTWRANRRRPALSTPTLARLWTQSVTISRIWRAFSLAPIARRRSSSARPLFINKCATSGLYLDPPDRALVLCWTEDQIHLDRTAAAALHAPGQIERRHPRLKPTARPVCSPHSIRVGKIIGQPARHPPGFALPRYIEKNVPEELDVHLIWTTMAPTRLRRFATGCKRPRFHLHSPRLSLIAQPGPNACLQHYTKATSGAASTAHKNWKTPSELHPTPQPNPKPFVCTKSQTKSRLRRTLFVHNLESETLETLLSAMPAR